MWPQIRNIFYISGVPLKAPYIYYFMGLHDRITIPQQTGVVHSVLDKCRPTVFDDGQHYSNSLLSQLAYVVLADNHHHIVGYTTIVADSC